MVAREWFPCLSSCVRMCISAGAVWCEDTAQDHPWVRSCINYVCEGRCARIVGRHRPV